MHMIGSRNSLTLAILFLLNLFSLLTACKRDDNSAQGERFSAAVRDSLSTYWSMMRDKKSHEPSISRAITNKALRLADSCGNIAEKTYTWMLAGAVYVDSNPDSSLMFTKKALELSFQNKSDTIRQSIYYNLAYMYYSSGDHHQTMNYLDSALKLAYKRPDIKTQASVLILMGHISRDQMNKARARESYLKALRIAEDNNRELLKGIILGNLSSITENKDSAAKYLSEAIETLKPLPAAREELCALYMNFATHTSSTDTAIHYYRKAIDLAESAGLSELLIAAYNNLGYTLFEMRQFNLAEQCYRDHAIPEGIRTNNFGWLSTVYDSYAELLWKRGETEKAYQFQKKSMNYKELDRERITMNQASLQNALLMARNREMEIGAKTEEIRSKNNKLVFLFIGIISLVLLVGLIMLFFLWKIQRKNLTMKIREVESARRIDLLEEQENKRMSMQLHDAIRPLTSVLLKQIENAKIPDPKTKESLTSSIRDSASELRKIAHRMNPVLRQKMSFTQLVRQVREDYLSNHDLRIILELPESEPEIGQEAMNHLYFIIQELLTNAGKYVKRGTLKLSFEQDFNNFYLFYEDDGPGIFQDQMVSKGMGFLNIKERAALVSGEAKVESEPGKGTRWFIHLPLNKF